MNVKLKSLVTNDGVIILIKAVTTGIDSQLWYNNKAFLSNLANKCRKILFSKKIKNVKGVSLVTNDGLIILIKVVTRSTVL